MEFKKNLASVLAGAYKLDYRWLTISDNQEVRIHKDITDTAETPLLLNFDGTFMQQLLVVTQEKKQPMIISEILVECCAAETHELYYDEAGYDAKAIQIRHKPNELTAIREEGERYLLTLNGVVKTNPGDWVIRGVNGEEYPCDPEIFKKLYDIVE